MADAEDDGMAIARAQEAESAAVHPPACADEPSLDRPAVAAALLLVLIVLAILVLGRL